MASLTTDVLIIGAGPAGSSAALFLAKRGIRCTVVDKAAFPRDKICGDALSGKTVAVLNKLDPQFREELCAALPNLESWGVAFAAPNGEVLRVPFASRARPSAAPGFIAKRIHFDYRLFQKMQENPLITIYENTELRRFEQTPEGITARSKEGFSVKTKLVLAADGAYSAFAKQVAGLRTEPAHNCFGLRAYYKNVSGLDTENFIELHFIRDVLPGYFWIFPLPNGEANVGLGIRADKATQKNINLKKAFERIVQQHPVIKERFASAELQGGIKLFGLPLGSKRRKLCGAHFMLCGDAAQLIDPFTGEGIGNAMWSGMLAAEQAERCLQNADFSASFMYEYERLLYAQLQDELLLSYRMQQLVNFPWLFNFVVRKAKSNKILQETISCMFEDLDMRARLKKPSFYLKLLFS